MRRFCWLRACLHGGGGPQIGEVTCDGSPHLSCKPDQIKMRHYMDRRVTPPKRVTSPTWGPRPPCKRALIRSKCYWTLCGFACIWESKWVGIIAIKTERTQIHFLSDVLVDVASLNLKVLNESERETPCVALGICGFHQSYFETDQTLNQFNRSVLLRDNSTFVVTIFYIVYMEAVAREFDDVSNVSFPFKREEKCDVTLLR